MDTSSPEIIQASIPGGCLACGKQTYWMLAEVVEYCCDESCFHRYIDACINDFVKAEINARCRHREAP